MKIITIPCSFDNYAYLLVCEKTGLAAVVDPNEAYPVWQALESRSARLTTIFCTHHHHDHVGGIEDLLSEQQELQVCGFESDRGRVPGMTTPLSDGDPVLFGECRGRVLHTPGHTSGSVCYLFGSSLFAGDTLFGAGCGRLFEGDAGQMYRSLHEKIAVLPPETEVYCGHEYTEKNLEFARQVEPGNEAVIARLDAARGRRALGQPSVPSSLALEMETNPFLRCDSEDIRKNFPGLGAEVSDVAVFSLIREARNSF